MDIETQEEETVIDSASYADYVNSVIDDTQDEPTPTDTTPKSEEVVQGPKVIGLEEDESATATDSKWAFAENLTPETVVATTPEGKPITAAELRDSYFRTEDYTRKTQEFQEQKQMADQIYDWYKSNETFITGLNSPDPNVKVNTLLEIAKNLGIELPTAQNGNQSTGLLNLEEFEHDQELYNLASQINQERQARMQESEKYSSLEKKFDQFTNSLSEQVQSREVEAELDSIASNYKNSGLNDINIDGAKALLGKPITAQQAMKLANYERIIKHNLIASQSLRKEKPNEISSASSHSIDTEVGNMSFTDYANKIFSNRSN